MQEIAESVKTIVRVPPHYNDIRKPTMYPEDPKWIQKAYRRKTIRILLGEESRRCEINKDIIETHFIEMAASKGCDTLVYEHVEVQEDRNRVPTSGITPDEVAKRLKKCENTAPGDDRITYKHRKAVGYHLQHLFEVRTDTRNVEEILHGTYTQEGLSKRSNQLAHNYHITNDV